MTPVVGVVFALAACGGTEEVPRPTAPEQNGTEDDLDFASCGAVVAAYEFQAVESFDEGSVQDSSTANDPVTGLPVDPVGWWVSTDGTNGNDYKPRDVALTTCEPGEPSCSVREVPADFTPTEGGAPRLQDGDGQCEPSRGFMTVRSEGRGFADWGMTFGANMRGPVRDASEWDGVAFWARRVHGTGASGFYFTFPDQYTSNQGGQYFCRDGLAVENLCDPFGRGVNVSQDWRVYLLPFDRLYQQGFGKASPLGRLEVEDIIGLSVQFGGGVWEFELDEIVYYRAR